MKLFNYSKVFGAFTNAQQVIMLSVEPSDRQERKMLEEANKLIDASWARRYAFLEKRNAESDDPSTVVDLVAEREAFYPKVLGEKVGIPLQFLQDFMVKKIAAMQNNVSIHNVKEVAELREVFMDYGVELYPAFNGLTYDYLNWTARDLQKPKLLVHCKDAEGEDVVIRFEAAGELCQKFLNAVLELSFVPGTIFDMSFEAIDPAIERNKKAGKKVADPGKYVNHNIVVTVDGLSHTGHPPKGTRFVQKPTMEHMERLFRQAQEASSDKAKPQGQTQRPAAPASRPTPAPAARPAPPAPAPAPAKAPAPAVAAVSSALPVFNDDI
jgi:hypothetical protein